MHRTRSAVAVAATLLLAGFGWVDGSPNRYSGLGAVGPPAAPSPDIRVR